MLTLSDTRNAGWFLTYSAQDTGLRERLASRRADPVADTG
jgi:hypothetical protein